jgi:hypothetical protein
MGMRPTRESGGMETAADQPQGAVPPAPREDDPEPARERRTNPIDEHHFQRPVVSPVPARVRTPPSGG